MTAFFMTLLILVLIVIVIDIYFWPFNIAIRKKVEDKLAVFIINHPVKDYKYALRKFTEA